MGFVHKLLIKLHRRSGDRFSGMDLLYLSTVGAKTGQKRQSALARLADGDDAWLVVASNGGAARHPSWYHNLRAHPGQVWVEVAGETRPASVEELRGAARAAAWERVVAAYPRFGGYERKTDRELPVLRLTAH